MEQDFIIDSSGFSTFAVACWRDSEQGTKNSRPNTLWFKIHLARGGISGAVLGFIVTRSDGPGSADVVNFTPLINGLVAHGFTPRYVIVDNIYLTIENINDAKALNAILVAPLKPKNFRKDKSPTEAAQYMIAFRGKYPDLYDALCRRRSSIESIFSSQNHYFDRVACIGTEEERAKARDGGTPLFVSREYEFWSRIIRHNFNVTVRQEKRRNRLISYRKSSKFSHVHETIDE